MVEVDALRRQPSYLLVRAGVRMCALPLVDVIEVMRPQPTEPLPGALAFVRGLAIIRGIATPVLDLSTFLDDKPDDSCDRLVTVRAGQHQVALAVREVIGICPDLGEAESLPPLAQAACPAMAAVAARDHHLMTVLTAARLVPESLWASIAVNLEGDR